MWLALVNVCLLGGILVGFAVGGSLAAFAPGTPWTLLYGVEALLMGLAGLWVPGSVHCSDLGPMGPWAHGPLGP